jgi:hypothetical protein
LEKKKKTEEREAQYLGLEVVSLLMDRLPEQLLGIPQLYNS